jgi:mitochondrial chaperone BCS1
MIYEPQQHHPDNAWLSGSNLMTRVMGFSFIASMLQSNSYMIDSVKWFLLGTIIESGRRFCQWLMERLSFRQYNPPSIPLKKYQLLINHIDLIEYSITAQFTEGDPAYEWIILFVVRRPHPFQAWITSNL